MSTEIEASILFSMESLFPQKITRYRNHKNTESQEISKMASIAADSTTGIQNSDHSKSKMSTVYDTPGLMNSEERRLESFRTWSMQAPVPSDRLAKAGFFYTGHDMEVQCFSCHLTIGEWSYNDIVMDKHKKFSPSCNFVNNKSDNIPLTARNPVVNSFTAASTSVARGPSYGSQRSVENSFDNYLENIERNYPLQYQELEKFSSNSQPKQVNGMTNGMTRNILSSPVSSSTSASNSSSSSTSHSPYVNGINGSSTTVFQNPWNSTYVQANRYPGTSLTNSRSAERISEMPATSEVRTTLNRFPMETFEIRMKYEVERLATFTHRWPHSFLHPRQLAQAGFYYLQVGDKCRCAFCRGVLMNWAEGDTPMAEHSSNFPLCPFVMNQNVGNVPVGGEDVCGTHSPYSGSETNAKGTLPLQNGYFVHKGPMHPSQATLDARLRSFQSWPTWCPMKAECLADAGFFYIGVRDNVKCFYCDIGLCNWEPADDAWVEHGRWSKKCAYVMLIKGQEFVNSCQERSEDTPRSNMAIEERPSPYNVAVEEAMQSDLIQNVLKTNVFAPHLIRRALLRKFETTGKGVSTVNELSEAVMVEMEESVPRRISSSCVPMQNVSSVTTSSVNAISGASEAIVPAMNPVSGTNGAIVPAMNSVSATNGAIVPATDMSLEEELRLLKENRICKVCLDREIEVVFLPCGHQIACRHCALALKDCAICREPVTGILRTFLP